MSAVEFVNAKGQVRYQPEHPDGRRLYPMGWMEPDVAFAFTNNGPRLYRTKQRAYRQVSRLIVRENAEARHKFKEHE